MVTYPKDWKACRLLERVSLVQGLTYTPENVKSCGTLVLRSSNIQDGRLSLDDNVYVDCSISEEKQIQDNDILVCVRNGSSALIGKSCILRKILNTTFGAFMSVLRGDETGYIAKIFAHDIVQSQVRDRSNATINQITKKDFESIKIVIPPIAEQKAIAATLSSFDTHIDNLTALIEKKKAIRDGALFDLMGGRTRLAGFSGEWKTKTIGCCVDIYQGGTPSTYRDDYWGGNIVWITPGEITKLKGLYIRDSERKITDRGLENSSAVLLPVGTILLCTRATIGDLAVSSCPITTNQGFKNLICRDNTDNVFFAYLLKNYKDVMIERAKGTTFLELSKTSLSNILVTLPPLAEQKAIADTLTSMDTEIQNLEAERDKMQAIRAGAMDDLLTGRVRLPM